ncbi:MAG: SO_0444 family Cu/Zn efflux transporter [Phycisphaeraceae bacterium]|nr:SO_0444 family Cu/Zn efflux transporter [Phycisphaeraceae bacterium]MCB9847405.1 SO_0444 family Cu/Zn efflux transporter [Phycisphaeraceae bacterium]
MRHFLDNLIELSLEIAPWLVVGLVASGLLQAFSPRRLVARLLGRPGIGSILRAAILGAPLPLCSCSVIPLAVDLRRQGASRGATASFLVSVPETGVDSVAVSYAMLGPFMTIARPIAAIVSAVCAGLGVELVRDEPARAEPAIEHGHACCCSEPGPAPKQSSCCHTQAPPKTSLAANLIEGQRYAFTTLFGDIAKWLVVGILVAAVAMTFIEPDQMARWGSGIWAMLAITAVGIPLYVCATASTPIGAAMLYAGISPGTVIVFLLVGPATNIATLGVVRSEFGNAGAVRYFAAVAGSAIATGLLTDLLVRDLSIKVAEHVHEHAELVPVWLAAACAIALIAIGAWNAVKPMLRKQGGGHAAHCH